MAVFVRPRWGRGFNGIGVRGLKERYLSTQENTSKPEKTGIARGESLVIIYNVLFQKSGKIRHLHSKPCKIAALVYVNSTHIML